MSLSRLRGETVDVRLWTPVEQVESHALTQLRNIASLPWVAHVAVMPDVHFGKGATVGSVIGMRGAVSPAAVGVDIGCGMGAVRTSLTASDLPDSLRAIRSDLEDAIPVGFAAHDGPVKPQDPRLRAEVTELLEGFDDLDPSVKDLRGRARAQLGTLG
ncbi:MAG: RtcB family protein, partial [Myxococcaceae bacterium]